MKNSLLIFACLLILLSTCKKDGGNDNGILGCMDPISLNYNPLATESNGSCLVPLNKQRSLVLEYTSVYCHYCGEWGYDTFNNLVQKYGNDIIPMSIHGNMTSIDPMWNDALFTSFTSCRASGLPKFWVGDIAGASNYSNLIEALNKKAPWAGVTLLSSRSGDTVVIKTMTKFFDNPVNTVWYGEYYINVYLTESGISGYNNGAYTQSNDHPLGRPDYKHNHVLRTAGTPTSAYGVLLVNGTNPSPIPEGYIGKKDFKIKLNPSWNSSQIKVSAVLWLKQGAYYYFINGYAE